MMAGGGNRCWGIVVRAGAAAATVAVAGCSGTLTPDLCPASRPADESRCFGPGTICEYDAGCADAYYRAACASDGVWHVEYVPDGCSELPDGGGGGTGGSAGAGGAGGGASGGAGGGASGGATGTGGGT